MKIPKPTFVLVPGAWHSPSSFDQLRARLQEADYPTVSLALPSLNPPNPNEIEVATDAAFIREKMLLPLLNEGKEVVLAVHSYGGCPGGAAAKGLSKSEWNSAGRHGGLVGLVFIAAFLAREGDSLLSIVGGKWDSWIMANEETGYLNVSDPAAVFYEDVSEPLTAESCASLLPHSMTALMSPSPPSAWADPEYAGRRAYIRCAQDRAIPAFAQDLMVQHSGVEWVVKELDGSHSPFLSRPAELAGCLAKLAEEFVREGGVPVERACDALG